MFRVFECISYKFFFRGGTIGKSHEIWIEERNRSQKERKKKNYYYYIKYLDDRELRGRGARCHAAINGRPQTLPLRDPLLVGIPRGRGGRAATPFAAPSLHLLKQLDVVLSQLDYRRIPMLRRGNAQRADQQRHQGGLVLRDETQEGVVVEQVN